MTPTDDGVAAAASATRWLWLLATATVVGLLAVAANVTSVEQMSGIDQGFAALRKTVSKVASAGVLWAGVAVLGGWLARRPLPAMVAGTVGLLVALVVHYGLADLTGAMPWASWSENRSWFVTALLLGPPLGLVGAAARRRDAWGLAARLVVPVGAVLEPFVVGWIPPRPFDIWANQVSGVAAGAILVAGGVVSACVVAWRWRRQRADR